MTDPPWSESSRVKVERAKGNIRQLETEFAAFREADPYRGIIEKDLQSGKSGIVVRVTDKPPLRWGVTAGEVAHDLRSPLDYLWRDVSGGRKGNYFPFWDAETLEQRYRAIEQPRLKRTVGVLKSLRMYETGYVYLRRLRDLNDADKHELLAPAFASLSYVSFRRKELTANFSEGPAVLESLDLKPEVPICPVEDGTVLYWLSPWEADQIVDMEPRLSLDIAFGEGEAIKGLPIISVLTGALLAVEYIRDAMLRGGVVD